MQNNKCRGGHGETGTLVHCWCIARAATVENSRAIPPKVKHRITIRSRNSPFRYILKRTENRDVTRGLYTHVHVRIVDTCRKVETTQVSIDGGLDKPNVVHPDSGVLFSDKRNELSSRENTQRSFKCILLNEKR